MDAPNGASKTIAIGKQAGEALAFYQSADGTTVLAPRGWHCQGFSGSGGASLLLSPKPIAAHSAGLLELDGPAIVVSYSDLESSGRIEVAEILARAFPAYRSLARQILEGFDSPIPPGPDPMDTVTRRSNKVVEYRTPPHTQGLGNRGSWLGKSDLPITGAAILVMDPHRPGNNAPDTVLLSVRLPSNLAWLAPTIIRYVERNAVSK